MGCACHVPGPVLNVRKRRVSPLLQDPTRTGWIRRAWIADFRRRFKRIAKALYDFIVVKDALGLRHKAPGAVFNVQPRQYQFLTDANKLKAFQQWLKEQLEAGLISVPAGQNLNEPWTSPYIQSAYRQGLQNAYEAEKSILGVTQDEEFFGRSVDQFLRDAFSQPETTSKVQLLATRSYEQLNGFNASTGSALNRIMAQAIIDGKGPASIYKDMSKQLGISERRALTIARTECLPGDTLVDGAVVRAVFRRWYDGDLFEIVTRNGRKFSATPNHPMLGLSGWIGAGLLKEGDGLICRSFEKDGVASGNVNVNARPTTIREIFDSLHGVGVLERKSGLLVDFHGDGGNGDVNILRPYRELSIGNFSSLSQKLAKQIFTPSGFSASGFCTECGRLLSVDNKMSRCHSPECNPFLFQSSGYESVIDTEAFCDAVYGFSAKVGIREIFGANITSELITDFSFFPGKKLGFGVGSVDSGFLTKRLYPIKPLALLESDLPVSKSGEVEIDYVLSVRVRKFSGHIFNLETPYGYFTINGNIYTGNTIYAHAEGSLDSFEALGVEDVGIQSEFSTAGDERVCPICQALEGRVYSVKEARGVIPVHPACRCSWLPVVAVPKGF